MNIKELEKLIELLKQFLASDGDLSEEPVKQTLRLVINTLEDSK